jgi:DNA-directed RNA polymerase specialized sigma24 family protein
MSSIDLISVLTTRAGLSMSEAHVLLLLVRGLSWTEVATVLAFPLDEVERLVMSAGQKLNADELIKLVRSRS